MTTLSPEARTRAVEFLQKYGRPLERALYAHHFENGPADAVLTELSKFQNPDGGFGHCMEPDIRLKDSSVIATSVGFQHLTSVGAPADAPIVVNGCRYLVETYDTASRNWPIIPPNIDDAPHAPWWNYDDDLNTRLINPRAELLSVIFTYPEHFTGIDVKGLADSVRNHLLAQSDEIEMHDLLCYIRLYEATATPTDYKAAIGPKLEVLVARAVSRDPETWKAYGLPPLSVVASPEAPFAPLFRAELEKNLDFLIEQQKHDGSWGPSWSWGDQWPHAWAMADLEWSSVITYNNLRTLRAFGRLS